MIQDIIGNSLLNRHDLDFTEMCNLKQGYLAYIMNSTYDDYNEKQIITAKPVFAVLNKDTLSLFENENVRSLLQSYPLGNLKKSNVPLNWNSTHCWQVLKGEGQEDKYKGNLDSSSQNNLELPTVDVITSLCASDEYEMKSWMEAIDQFHNCEVKAVEIKKTSTDYIQKIKDEDEEVEQEKTNADDEQILEIGSTLDGVVDSIRREIVGLNQQRK